MSSEEIEGIFSSLKCPSGRFFQNHCSLVIKNFFLTSSLNLSSPTLKLPPLVLPLQAIIKSLSPFFLSDTLHIKGHNSLFPELSLCQAKWECETYQSRFLAWSHKQQMCSGSCPCEVLKSTISTELHPLFYKLG